MAQGSPLPDFDVQAPLLSVPGIVGTTLDSIPAQFPYLCADPERVEYWREELQNLRAFTIGIAWQGNPGNERDKQRSFPVTQFENLTRIVGVRLVSLQKGPGTDQLQSWAERSSLLDLSNRLDMTEPFVDTAAVMMNLDLVVTVDTAVAHLAGALARPVWVPLPFSPDWRWLLERSDSPWYRTMRLFLVKASPAHGGKCSNESPRKFAASAFSPVSKHRGGRLAQKCIFCQGDVTPDLRTGAKPWYHSFMPTVSELFQLALQWIQGGDFAQAAECYRQALSIQPDNVDAHNNLGSALLAQGRPTEAAECYRQALRINFHYANAHYNLGNILFGQAAGLTRRPECYRQAIRCGSQPVRRRITTWEMRLNPKTGCPRRPTVIGKPCCTTPTMWTRTTIWASPYLCKTRW